MVGPRRFIIQRLTASIRLQKTDATQTAPNQSVPSENFSRKQLSNNTCFASTGNKSPKQRTESEIHEFK